MKKSPLLDFLGALADAILAVAVVALGVFAGWVILHGISSL